MPLLDHFQPPLSLRRHGESFHAAWASTRVDRLNQGGLPHGYFAEEQIHPGARVEIDVATFEEEGAASAAGTDGATATLTAPAWAPLAAAMMLPAAFPESFAVQVFAGEGGMTLVAAIELISPSNKDRRSHRRAFAAKCASYLAQGIGLVLVDIVTERQHNLHNEIVSVMEADAAQRLPAKLYLYTVAYRPSRHDDVEQIEVWPTPLALGQPLPIVPLALRGGVTVPIDLEAAYVDVCRRRLG